MKTTINILAVLFLLACFSCSKDDDAGNSKLTHVGQKWKIISVDYTIVDQGLSNPLEWVKKGTATEAGAFYLNGNEGSFDILIEGDRNEDYFGYTMNNSNITIIQIDQSFSPSRFSQNVISISGEKITDNSMTVSGTITKQGVTGQYVFTGDFTLVKE